MRARRLTRRGFFERLAGALAAVGWVSSRSVSAEESDGLVETPSNDEGPYYREGSKERKDLRVQGSKNPPLTISGLVRAEDGKPLAGVVLDLWHADAQGAYDMDSPDFRHRGRLRTDAEGRYRFVTNLPGRYGLWNGTSRPRHIHVKLLGRGLYDLTTQMYFGVRPDVDVAAELCPTVVWSGRGATRAGSGTWDVVLSRKT